MSSTGILTNSSLPANTGITISGMASPSNSGVITKNGFDNNVSYAGHQIKPIQYCNSLNQLFNYQKYVSGKFIYDGYEESENHLSDLKDVPILEVYDNVDLGSLRLADLSGIGRKCFKIINGILVIRTTVKQNILGLVSIEKMVRVIPCYDALVNSDNLIRAIGICGRNKDIMECREELIAAELKEYARL